MDRVKEFHNIMPIRNVPSVMEQGLLSNERAAKLDHEDISLAPVQDQRDKKTVPGGLKLHKYANTYFDARNPMMSRRRDQANSLCVLIISKEILTIPGTVVADQNAASDYVRFMAPSEMSEYTLDLDLIYADDWRHDNQIEYWRHKSRKCAEVLVPDMIDVDFIQGAYVKNQQAAESLQKQGFELPVHINARMFFG